MLKFANFLKAKLPRASACEYSTDAYSPDNIEETRKVQRAEYMSNLGTWDEQTCEKYFNKAKKALLTSDEFPVTVQYDGLTSVDDSIMYVIHHLKELGYTVSHVHQVTRYGGQFGSSHSSAILNINLPASQTDPKTSKL